MEVECGAVITPEPAPTKKGMTFSGWGDVPETMPAYDLTLTGTYSWSKEIVEGIIYQVTDTLSNYVSVIGNDNINGDAIIHPAVKIGEDTYSVNSIGAGAFADCSGLTSVTIPKSVTSIGGGAFEGCSLPNILVKCATPPSVESASFTEATFYHAMLYIPTGSWYAYAFKSNWYKFINIRETTTEEEQLSMQQAYTLMDAGTFAYSVYDPVNDCIGTINSVGIDENNPNHSWQVIEADGGHYLYNVGAKKFVVSSGNGSFTLSDTPTSIDMENGDNGIIIGAQPAKQWALVTNERMSAEQAIIDGIDDISTVSQPNASYYDIQGRKLFAPQKGINIIRHSDGTSRKVLIK